ncbi:peptidase [Sphaerisporangium siamense]|uniref:Pimeloyl-ACP methyl ester carboxylesterase n=1 Tax=Sphaerisporangium siamense TaxID=795645 RepID=A0A7W7DDE1_9ACTN|nr:alpha/beta fold hydrolase [Sphaerisporangium siamense]MBB4704774.1 pimeloyl-ACP methyl ester carboxylesterase [Sphaerisporangium siamense]GII88727.1 peptidase [Sphaerisporangium siamense]
MRRTLLSLTAVLAATVALSPLAPARATPTAPAAASGEIAWTPCPRNPAAECGTLTVPVDWEDPGGPTFKLAVARLKATDPAARIGTLLFNLGGPGVSGVTYTQFGNTFSPEVQRRFDVVGFDPRGVEGSSPVKCSLPILTQFPDPLIKNQAEFDSWLDYSTRFRADCRARTGPVFDHVDSVSVARDMDAIRAALGEQKITYYGLSYGTLIGQMYAELFPRRIRALVLDSNEDHSLSTGPYLASWAANVQDSFDEFVKWCGTETRCALHGKDVRALWTSLLERADRGEIRNPSSPSRPLTRMDVIRSAFRAGYGPTWYELATLLAALDAGSRPPASTATLTRAATGTQTNPFQAATNDPKTDTDARQAAAEDPAVSYPNLIFCADFRWPIRDYKEYAKHLRRAQAVAPDMGIVPTSLTLTGICLSAPDPIPNPQHRLRVKGTPPLLLANALHDPATGYLWALNSAAQIGKEARLLTYEGWGHGVYGRSECTTTAIDRYLISVRPPAPGTRCPAIPPVPPKAASGLSDGRPAPWPPLSDLLPSDR